MKCCNIYCPVRTATTHCNFYYHLNIPTKLLNAESDKWFEVCSSRIKYEKNECPTEQEHNETN